MEALKKRFKPVDIEELRGIEFHQKMQEQQSVEQLGIELQWLGRRPMPVAKYLIVYRRVDSSCQMATKTGSFKKNPESFSELYDRACTLKRQEKQISASAAITQEQLLRNLQQTI